MDHNKKLEFALAVLYAMPGHKKEPIEKLFTDVREQNLFPESDLKKIEDEAYEVLPIAELMYDNGREADLQKFRDFRDRILMLAGIHD